MDLTRLQVKDRFSFYSRIVSEISILSHGDYGLLFDGDGAPLSENYFCPSFYRTLCYFLNRCYATSYRFNDRLVYHQSSNFDLNLKNTRTRSIERGGRGLRCQGAGNRSRRKLCCFKSSFELESWNFDWSLSHVTFKSQPGI